MFTTPEEQWKDQCKALSGEAAIYLDALKMILNMRLDASYVTNVRHVAKQAINKGGKPIGEDSGIRDGVLGATETPRD